VDVVQVLCKEGLEQQEKVNEGEVNARDLGRNHQQRVKPPDFFEDIDHVGIIADSHVEDHEFTEVLGLVVLVFEFGVVDTRHFVLEVDLPNIDWLNGQVFLGDVFKEPLQLETVEFAAAVQVTGQVIASPDGHYDEHKFVVDFLNRDLLVNKLTYFVLEVEQQSRHCAVSSTNHDPHWNRHLVKELTWDFFDISFSFWMMYSTESSLKMSTTKEAL
jgi:hypothetical protein